MASGITNGEIINFGSTGIETQNRDNIFQYLTEQFQAIYGENTYIGIGTEEYNYLSLLADVFSDMGVTAVQVGNGYNLVSATGSQLDNIASIFYGNIARNAGSYSTISVQLTGQIGTVINNGRLIDSLGGYWTLPTPLTFTTTTLVVTATYTQLGAYFITQEQLNGSSAIATPVTGWTNVSATADAVVGSNVETDTAFRTRLAILSNSTQTTTSGALLASMLSLTDTNGNTLIQKAALWINDDVSSTLDFDNVSLTGIPHNSICLSLLPMSGVEFTSSGSPTADGQLVANTIYLRKGIGVGTYSGSNADNQVAITVSAQSSGETTTNFTTTVGFAQAETVNVYVAVVLEQASASSDLVDTTTQGIIQTAVQNKVAEQAIGANIYKSILFEPVLSALAETVGSTAYTISNIAISLTELNDIGSVNTAIATNNLQMTYYQSAVVPVVTFFTNA